MYNQHNHYGNKVNYTMAINKYQTEREAHRRKRASWLKTKQTRQETQPNIVKGVSV